MNPYNTIVHILLIFISFLSSVIIDKCLANTLRPITLGMERTRVEQLNSTDCTKAIDAGWKPKGSVKNIKCDHMKMEFVYDKLHYIEYLNGFDLDRPLIPFLDTTYNIPSNVQENLSWKLSKKEIILIIDDWKEYLIKKGLTFVKPKLDKISKSLDCPTTLKDNSFCVSNTFVN